MQLPKKILVGLVVVLNSVSVIWASTFFPQKDISSVDILAKKIQKNFDQLKGIKVVVDKNDVEKLGRMYQESTAINELILALDLATGHKNEQVKLKANSKQKIQFENIEKSIASFLFEIKNKVVSIDRKGLFAKQYVIRLENIPELKVALPQNFKIADIKFQNLVNRIFRNNQLVMTRVTNLRIEITDLLNAYTTLGLPQFTQRKVTVIGDFSSFNMKIQANMLPQADWNECPLDPPTENLKNFCNGLKEMAKLNDHPVAKKSFKLEFLPSGISANLLKEKESLLSFKFFRHDLE